MTNTLKPSSEELLLIEIDDILKTMPAAATIRHETPANFAWLGRTSAAITRWNTSKGIALNLALQKMNTFTPGTSAQGYRELMTILYEAQSDLRMSLTGPLSISAGPGMVFDFFDALRKTIEQANVEILFVDPYLSPDFVSRYLPHIAETVRIRLLTGNKNEDQKKRLSTLIPAVEAFHQQSKKHIQVRASSAFHDRYVFIDGKECHHSSQSFKDGAKTAPVMITQVIDTFPQTLKTYEDIWSSAVSEYPISVVKNVANPLTQ